MNYYCNECKNFFSEPALVSSAFEHDFGWQDDSAYVCPFCECPDYEKTVPCACERCNTGRMSAGDKICRDCRAALLRRVIDFFDTLTEEEEEQFDEWMDGDSIKSRRDWN